MQKRLRISGHGSRTVFLITTLGLSLACEGGVSPEQQLPIGAMVTALGNDFSGWATPVNAELDSGLFNTSSLDGCPFISPDGKTFYMASNRPGGHGGLDIWVSVRASENDPWGDPENVTSVNTAQDDFCPTMSRDGQLLYFVSATPGCGMGDVYVARRRPDGFDPAVMLPCDGTAPYDAVNSPFNEFSPFPQLDPGVGPTLYFSSFRPGGFAAEPAGGTPDSDLYWSVSRGGVFGAVELIPGVNTTSDDGQPNVSSDGLELFFYSTRPGGVGAADLYVASRVRAVDAWSAPSNLGVTVNSTQAETRPSLSWDGLSLYFGSTRAGGEGSSDIWVTTRQRLVPLGH